MIQNHEIIFTKDSGEMFDYFYFFRKLWEDQAARQHLVREEFAKMLE